MKARPSISLKRIEHRYLLMLVFLLLLFCLRVSGQLLVALFAVPFLPPMEEWFSGAIPYPELLACQILIILLYGKVCVDFTRGHGVFVTPSKRLGKFLLQFGTIYLSLMIIRYVIRMGLYPTERWTGGSIPIFFHWVLASFLLVLGNYHRKRFQPTPESLAAERKMSSARLPGTIGSVLGSQTLFWMIRLVILMGTVAWVSWQLLPSVLAFQQGLRPSVYAVREQPNVAMTTSDGVRLMADIYHPQHIRSTPTILVRIPLTKSLMNGIYANLMGRIWAERGYTVIIQGTRGRFGSGGNFYPLKGESKDGGETLLWLQRQTWFNGQIATWGGSAFGYTQWCISDRSSPGLSVLYIYQSASDFRKMFYPGGAFSLYSALSWAINSRGRQDLPNWPSDSAVRRAADGVPLLDADKRAVGSDIPFFRDWAIHNTNDPYWQELAASDKLKALQSPALLMAGWYDPFLPAQLDDFAMLRQSPHPEVAKRSRLIIGPWTHAGQVTLTNGQKAELFRPASFALSLPWFDQVLKEYVPQHPEVQPPVRIFVMGRNEWRNEQEWPLSRTLYTGLYLRSSGHANGNDGAPEGRSVQANVTDRVESKDASLSTDGVLLLSKPEQDQPDDSYTYDPNNPVPTVGGAMIGNGAGVSCQNAIERRADVLIYTTPELRQDIEVTGPVSALLYVSTSAPQTDFTAKLVDIQPDGAAFNVSDGIMRGPYQTRSGKGLAGAKSAIHQIRIELWPTSMVFARGHRIRLEVSSSNFPRYDRNPNTRNFIPSEIHLEKARQTVHHSCSCPSELILPIIPPSSAERNPSSKLQEYFK